jgi:hypothetical protein
MVGLTAALPLFADAHEKQVKLLQTVVIPDTRNCKISAAAF